MTPGEPAPDNHSLTHTLSFYMTSLIDFPNFLQPIASTHICRIWQSFSLSSKFSLAWLSVLHPPLHNPLSMHILFNQLFSSFIYHLSRCHCASVVCNYITGLLLVSLSTHCTWTCNFNSNIYLPAIILNWARWSMNTNAGQIIGLVISSSTTRVVQRRCIRYGGGAGNTVEENSSIFSLIRMR